MCRNQSLSLMDGIAIDMNTARIGTTIAMGMMDITHVDLIL